MADDLHMKQWLDDQYGNTKTGPPSDMKQNVYLDTDQVQAVLGLVARNHAPDTELVGDRQFMQLVLSQEWGDDGKAVANLTDWAARAAADPANPEHKLAKEAAANLINAVTINQSDPGDLHQNLFNVAVDSAKDNPEIARAFSRIVAANIADFGEDEPGSDRAFSTNGDLAIPTDQRYRLAMLGGMDPQGRAIMHIAAEAYKLGDLSDGPIDKETARRGAAIDAIITAGGHNALYYENIDAADAENKARAAAIADDQAVSSVLRKFYDTTTGTISGGLPIGVAKDLLTSLLDEGMKLPEPDPVLPAAVSTKDATSVLMPEVRAAHDYAEVRLNATGTHGTGLRPEMFTTDADGHPRLKDISEMNGIQKTALRTWAEEHGGDDYVTTYAELFGRTYATGELVDKGDGAMIAYVRNPNQA
jgi:hypothetical protein